MYALYLNCYAYFGNYLQTKKNMWMVTAPMPNFPEKEERSACLKKRVYKCKST